MSVDRPPARRRSAARRRRSRRSRPSSPPTPARARPRPWSTGWRGCCWPAPSPRRSSASPTPRPPPPRCSAGCSSVLGDWAVMDDADLREQLAELEGEPRRLRRRRPVARPRPVRPRPGDAGRPEDPDHPRLLREAAAALPAGGRRLAGLPGDGRRRGAPRSPARRATAWRDCALRRPGARRPRPTPASRWRSTSTASRRCSPPSRRAARPLGGLSRGRDGGLDGAIVWALAASTCRDGSIAGRSRPRRWRASTAASGAQPPRRCGQGGGDGPEVRRADARPSPPTRTRPSPALAILFTDSGEGDAGDLGRQDQRPQGARRPAHAPAGRAGPAGRPRAQRRARRAVAGGHRPRPDPGRRLPRRLRGSRRTPPARSTSPT